MALPASILQIGTRAAQPAATDVAPGTLYSVTDESNLVEQSDGAAWATYAGAGGGGGSPGGADTQVQYNNAGAFGGITGATTNGTALTLVAPVLGTPASGTLTNATGLPIATGVSGLGANVATFLATPSSANLAAALTDETGSGANVFATSPTLVTPALGTPSAAVLTNATGLPLTTGVTGTLPIANGGTGQATATAAFDALAPTTTAGDVIYHNGTDNIRLAIGTAGQALVVNAGATAPEWDTLAAGGNVNAAGTLTSGALVIGQGAQDVATTGTGTGVVTALGVNVGSAGAVVVNGGALGTPSSGTLTNATGLPISTGVSGLGANVATFLATPSSANLASAVTGETGSGALVFATSPALVTPDLGTPSAAVLPNATGLPIATGVSGLGAGVGTFLATPSSANLAAAVTGETGSGALVFGTSPALTTPNLGTPSAATLTNATGLPISTGVSGLGANVATFLATPSSANLAGALTDETGSGAAVFATSPTLVTPALGTPSALVLTNATGLPLTTGVTGVLPIANVGTLPSVGMSVTFDGGGSTLTTGIKLDVEVPFACTLTAVRLAADQSGSIVIDVWKDTYANYPPTDADSITAAAPPTISTAVKSEDVTLTGWTTTVTAGDWLRFNIDSVTSITRCTLSFRYTRT
jgi:hypothetical protein